MAGSAVLLVATATACGSSTPTTTRVTGNCALEGTTYQLSPLSADQLRAALGADHYTLRGTVMTDEGHAKTARIPLNGSCSYVDSHGKQRLTIAVSTKHLLGDAYDASRKIQKTNPLAHPIPGLDGYVMTAVDPATGKTTTTAVGFRPGYLVSVDLISAGKGVNVSSAASTLVKETLGTFGKPVPLASAG